MQCTKLNQTIKATTTLLESKHDLTMELMFDTIEQIRQCDDATWQVISDEFKVINEGTACIETVTHITLLQGLFKEHKNA